jgi:hypothetical protein
MYYFCSLCGSDRETRQNWFFEKEFPTHLFRTHGHRLRTIKEIQNDWGMLGLLETSEMLPTNTDNNYVALPKNNF